MFDPIPVLIAMRKGDHLCHAGPHQIDELEAGGWVRVDAPANTSIPLERVPGMRDDWAEALRGLDVPDTQALAGLEPAVLDVMPISGIGGKTAVALVKAARGVVATATAIAQE
jgi:hypothetical protein